MLSIRHSLPLEHQYSHCPAVRTPVLKARTRTFDIIPARSRHQGHQQHRCSWIHCSSNANESGSTIKGKHPTESTPASAADNGELKCMGTGMDVACSDDVNGLPQQTSPETLQAAAEMDQTALAQLTALLLLISPFFFWGTSMVAFKLLAPHTAPIWVSAVRLLPAGLVLIGWAARQGRPQPQGPMAWAAISLFALADGTCFQGFLAEGLQRTSAGLGSVIIDSQPLTVALLASLLFGERLGALGFVGLGLGVVGLCLLEVPVEALQGALTGSLGSLTSLTHGGSLWDSGEWWMLLAAQSMAVGTVMVPWVCRFADPVMATGYHMLLGGLPLLALSAYQESDVLLERLPQLTGQDALLLLYISLLGSAASYGVFFFNASRGNLTALSSLTFLTPLFAAITGFFVLGEVLTPVELTGATVTLGAVYLLNKKPSPGNKNV
ncbi:g5178 [Coccomyxa viridis]|uniref:G5178 protein n=1 Tax=Coccomyxa viridis TaxID=1274662 RepID=A0ABP1FS65_9CHLO